ncbi:MAG: hypothetical protein ACRDUB_21200, partial [Mycobacterium sp.]
TAQVQSDLAQWKPILQWLRPVLQPIPQVAPDPASQRTAEKTAPGGAAQRLTQVREPVRRPVAPVTVINQSAPRPEKPVRAAAASPMSRLLDALPIPRFLQRTP